MLKVVPFFEALYTEQCYTMIFLIFRLGTFIERADNTARAINEKYHLLLETASTMGGQEDKAQWKFYCVPLGDHSTG